MDKILVESQNDIYTFFNKVAFFLKHKRKLACFIKADDRALRTGFYENIAYKFTAKVTLPGSRVKQVKSLTNVQLRLSHIFPQNY